MKKEENNRERGPLFIFNALTFIYISRRNNYQNEGNPMNQETQTDFQRLPFPKGNRDQIDMISTEKKNLF